MQLIFISLDGSDSGVVWVGNCVLETYFMPKLCLYVKWTPVGQYIMLERILNSSDKVVTRCHKIVKCHGIIYF